MQRRSFIKGGSLAGLTLSSFLQANAKVPSLTESRADMDDNFLEVTIDDLQRQMQDNKLTSREITRWYLERIEKLDKRGPALQSVIEINPDALAIAEAMDDERKNGKVRSALHGIPVLIKDNIDTADKMMTTAGSIALLNNIAAKDAFIVARLREAGAVLLGKTNLSEFANFRSSHSTSGWSSRGGQTKCPYVLNRNPSGSSAGSGTAAAANLCAVAIGTETDGSIVSPSSVNGLVGVKPTVGLWSRSGIIPISATQDTAGPMTRTVKDAAILLSLLSAVDANDKATLAARNKMGRDYTKYLVAGALKGKRLGIEKSFLTGNPYVVDLLKNTINHLKSLGATIVEIDLLKQVYALGNAEFTVLQYEFKDGLNKYLSKSNATVKDLGAVIAFNKVNETTAMPYFKQETLISSNKKGDLTSAEYKQALAKSATVKRMIDTVLQQHKLDAICGTTNGLACCIDLVNGDYDTGFSFSTPAAVAGYPHITVPMGFVKDLPIGFSFVGTAYSEPQLFAMAYSFEQATKARRPPAYVVM